MPLVDHERQAALMGVYYESEWAARMLPAPGTLPTPLRPLPIAQALNLLVHDTLPGWVDVNRLAIAAIARGGQAHGPNYSAYVNQLASHLSVEAAPIIALPGLVPGGSESDRNERFFRAYLLSAPGIPGAAAGCGLRNFHSQLVFGNNTTDALANVEVSRPVSDFTGKLDPRNWSTTLPLIWEESYEVDVATLPADRGAPPNQSSAKAADFVLFEKARWTWGIGRFAFWRTLLSIQYGEQLDATLPGNKIRTDYKLIECLENEFFGTLSPGGIDIDHGHGECSLVLGPTVWSKLEAQKVVRFTKPTTLYPQINQLASIFLLIWMESLVLLGACA